MCKSKCNGMMDLMNLAETTPEKTSAAPKVETLNTKKTDKKRKDVTEAHPGTKKVMKEVSFVRPTWEDKAG